MTLWRVLLSPVLSGLPVGITLIDTVGYVARVEGTSMQPLFNPDSTTDYVFLNRWLVNHSSIKRGDVISLISPKNPDHKIIKRVIGIQGDVIKTVSSKARVVSVPKGYCWVEGDHTGHSMDSNHFGPVSLGLVTAKATAIVWPPNRWQKVRTQQSFVKHTELSFHGNIHQSALCLGDVDNDGNNELIIGNTSGNLFIYKEQECVQTINSLGMITAVGVGDILKCGSNVLVVIAGNGWCHIFLCLSAHSEDSCTQSSSFKLESVYVQRIPANTKTLLIGDIDNDGCLELVLGLTDRVVRSYRWMRNLTGGRLVCLNKWECANQIGNVTLSYDSNLQPSLLISQPGGTFMRIRCHTNPKCDSDKMIVDYHPLTSNNMRNNGISSKIIGNLTMYQKNRDAHQTFNSLPYAIATLDGTLMLVKDEKIIWSIQVDQQLFALNKMDVTGDGNVELIACSWEGHTYILDQYKNAIRFQTQDPVADFCAGLYKLDMTKEAVPCLIYATFNNTIQIFYDVCFTDITAKNLIQMIEQNEEKEASISVFKNIKNSKRNVAKKLMLSWYLYGNHNLR